MVSRQMQQLSSFKYNFAYQCSLLRFLQIVGIVLNMVLVFLESGNLSYFWFSCYMFICGIYLHHVVRKFVFNIDGRYDLQRVIAEEQMTAKAQYAVSSFSACLLCWPMWYIIVFENSSAVLLSYLAGLDCITAAHGLLFLEIFDIVTTKDKQ